MKSWIFSWIGLFLSVFANEFEINVAKTA